MMNILAATDLSAASRPAIERACRLAGELGARLHLTHAIAPGLFDDIQRLLAPGTPPIAVTLGNDATKTLHGIADELQRASGIRADSQVAFGKPVDALLDHADEIAADLLVVGSRGESLLRQLTLGSTALSLLRKTRRPILVVRHPVADGYRRALVAMDFSAAALAALRQTRTIAPAAELTLAHAVEIPFERKMHYAGVDGSVIERYRHEARIKAMQRLRQLVDDEKLPEAATHLLALDGAAADVLLEQAQVQDCDLIAVGKRGAHIVEELLLGSTTRHVLLETGKDVLVASD